jgi:hypothetical protein
MKKNKKSKKNNKLLKNFFFFLLKIPIYLIVFIAKSIIYLSKLIFKLISYLFLYSKRKIISNKSKKESTLKKSFKIILTESGSFNSFLNSISKKDSLIGLILGKRGSGKTAFAITLLENLQTITNKKFYAIGFDEKEMPHYIKVVKEISQIKNNSLVLIDEGGIMFSSRSSMSDANKFLSRLMLIARHKNITILFISQNSSNIDINVLRQSDFLILKSSALLQKDFERKVIQELYDKQKENFENFKKDKGITYIYSDNFKGFVSNSLPTFWKESISKSFR